MASTWGTSWGTSWGVSWNRAPAPPPPLPLGGGVPAYRRQIEESRRRHQKSELELLMMIYVALQVMDD